MAIGDHTWRCWRIPVSREASQHSEGMARAWQPLTRAQAARLGRGSGRTAPPSFGFSVETLVCLSVLLRIKFHLFAVVQELGPRSSALAAALRASGNCQSHTRACAGSSTPGSASGAGAERRAGQGVASEVKQLLALKPEAQQQACCATPS